MAYVNEFGETVGCTLTSADRMAHLLKGWPYVVIPAIVLLAGYFILAKFVKNKWIRIGYILASLILIVWWTFFLYNSLRCA